MILQAPSLSRLWRGSCDRMFFSTAEDGIHKGSSMTLLYDNDLRCHSMEFDLDVWEDLHLTKGRFPTLVRTYVNPDEFADFLVRCANVMKERGAVTKMTAIPHKPRGINRTKKTGNYAHGGCILGWGFRIDKGTKAPVMSMHSRMSYLPYMGGLDLALSYHMAKVIGGQLGFTVEDFGFRWYCDSFGFAHMQSVAYVWNNEKMMEAIGDVDGYPGEEYPTIKLMRNTLHSFMEKKQQGFKPEEEKFAQLMRYRRRWESRVDGDGQWPSLPLSELNLNALRQPRRVEEEDESL